MHLAELLRGGGKLVEASETVQAAMERYEAAGASHPVAASRREAAARFLKELRPYRRPSGEIGGH